MGRGKEGAREGKATGRKEARVGSGGRGRRERGPSTVPWPEVSRTRSRRQPPTNIRRRCTALAAQASGQHEALMLQ